MLGDIFYTPDVTDDWPDMIVDLQAIEDDLVANGARWPQYGMFKEQFACAANTTAASGRMNKAGVVSAFHPKQTLANVRYRPKADTSSVGLALTRH